MKKSMKILFNRKLVKLKKIKELNAPKENIMSIITKHSLHKFILINVILLFIISTTQAISAADKTNQLLLQDDGEDIVITYATDLDRVLIRWEWTDTEQPTFDIYRQSQGSSEQLLAQVTPVTDPATAVALLNTTDTRWPTLSQTLIHQFAPQGVTNVSDLYNYLHQDGMVALKLAAEYYPVALMMGWGYLDQSAVMGTTYTYRVEAVYPEGVMPLDEVSVTAGQLTPFTPPTGLTAVDTGPGSPYTYPKDGSWGEAQRNLRFERKTYLIWDTTDPQEGYLDAPAIGYDIYRASTDNPNDFTHISGDIAIQPQAASALISETVPFTSTAAHDVIDYYFLDRPPTYGDYIYRIAPRDLLGRVLQWPDDSAQFSELEVATAYDYLPPDMPLSLAAKPTFDNSAIRVTWTTTPTADLDHFIIQTSSNFNCDDVNGCWDDIIVPANTSTWLDNTASMQEVRWYRVMAVDAAGNRSIPRGPVNSIIHDTEPPGAPELDSRRCDPLTGIAYCLDIHGTPDTARLLLFCRFTPDGEELFVAEFESDIVIGVDWPAIYQPPLTLEEVTCRAIAADTYGNMTDLGASDVETFILTSDESNQVSPPIITNINAVYESNTWRADIQWDITDTPAIKGFRILRQYEGNPPQEIAVILDAQTRSYQDTNVMLGVAYTYWVEALVKHSFGSDQLSNPYLQRIAQGEQRPLEELTWVDINWGPATGTSLLVDGPLLTPSLPVAIYRSRQQDANYIQLTPIKEVATAVIYADTMATDGCYWYVVVGFDARTGEPLAYTTPNSPNIGCPNHNSPTYEPSDQPFPNPNNTPCPIMRPTSGEPLRFGGGFEIENFNYTWNNATNDFDGAGDLRLDIAGTPLYLPIAFTNLTVGDDQNHICTGNININDVETVLGHALSLQAPPEGLHYIIDAINLQPWFGPENTSKADITIILPSSMQVRNVSGPSTTIELQNVNLNHTLQFHYDINLGQDPTHSCTTPNSTFEMETLPVSIVPLGLVVIDEMSIQLSESCMRYLDRYTGAWGPRPVFGGSPLDTADSNEWLLHPTYNSVTAIVDSNGLTGGFDTAEIAQGITSYPYGFQVEITGGISLELVDSQIDSGLTGAGSLTMAYHHQIDGNATDTIQATLTESIIGQRGALTSNVDVLTSVTWRGFTITGNLWQLYFGAITTPGLPATVVNDSGQSIMWQPRPNDNIPINAGAGEVLPGLLEPGLNRRQPNANFIWLNCNSPEPLQSVAADFYLRHGGVTQWIVPLIEDGHNMLLHGYQFELHRLYLLFLDNDDINREINGDIYLPFPSDITLPLTNMWFDKTDNADQACLGGGQIPAGEQDKTLDFWEVEATFTSVEFRVPERTLWTIGSMTLPHLTPMGDNTSAAIPMHVAFEPDGTFANYEESKPMYDEPGYYFDEFPFLMTDFRLSDVGESPIWEANATIAPTPAINASNDGFIGLNGEIVTPYFGPLTIPNPQPDEIITLGWNNYIGFSEHPIASRTWVDLDIVNIEFAYDQLVYVHDVDENRGMFTGFRNYAFVPDEFAIPPDIQVLNLDTAVVLVPSETGVYLGLNSATTAFRALAEATQTGLPTLPGELNTWGNKLGLDGNATTIYADLTADIWSDYGENDTYTDTIYILNALSVDALPDEHGVGGGTQGLLDYSGVKIKRMRGVVELSGVGLETQFERFIISTEVTIMGVEESNQEEIEAPLLYAELLSLEINRHGDFIIIGNGIKSKFLEGTMESLDVSLRINPLLPQLEGGLTIYGMDFASVHLIKGAAAIGIGAELNYIGVSADMQPMDVPDFIDNLKFGGELIAGVINTKSQILQNHFPDTMATLEDEIGTSLGGVYTRLYVTGLPVVSKGCMLDLEADGSLALWYFAVLDDEQSSNYGGAFRLAIYGKVLCVSKARGDLRLDFGVVNGQAQFTGEGYAAAGIGKCEPETWGEWAQRWWGDKWCVQGGAYLYINYGAGDGWDINFDTDREELFP